MKYGVIKYKIDKRDIIHGKKAFLSKLPKIVDLRLNCSPIVDQGQLGSCTANAIVSGLREYFEKPFTIPLSRLYLYWEERKIEGTINSDSGAQIRDGMKVLNKIGVCPEIDWPYDINTFTNTPSNLDNTNASFYKISSYQRITSLTMLKTALSKNEIVVFGFNVYESFESDQVAKTGIVPMPKKNEQLLGGHAVCAVGYADNKKYVIVRNSWGSDWGDKGYCYMPYTVFNKLVMDMWTGLL